LIHPKFSPHVPERYFLRKPSRTILPSLEGFLVDGNFPDGSERGFINVGCQQHYGGKSGWIRQLGHHVAAMEQLVHGVE
jgi:hypothetical protein